MTENLYKWKKRYIWRYSLLEQQGLHQVYLSRFLYTFLLFFVFYFLSSVVLSLTLFLFISTIPFLWNLYLSCYFHNEKTINQRLRSYPTVYDFLINRLIFYLYTIAWNWWYALWILEFRKTIAFHICHSYTWVHRCLFDS